MIIKEQIYKEIIHTSPIVPPEVGGILGCKNGIVTQFNFVEGTLENKIAVYSPDTNKMNKIISYWQTINICFCGIFHSHPFNQESLSLCDLEYIKKIILSMPDNINTLYFPIVIPRQKIISFVAQKYGDKVLIYDDEIKKL